MHNLDHLFESVSPDAWKNLGTGTVSLLGAGGLYKMCHLFIVERRKVLAEAKKIDAEAEKIETESVISFNKTQADIVEMSEKAKDKHITILLSTLAELREMIQTQNEQTDARNQAYEKRETDLRNSVGQLESAVEKLQIGNIEMQREKEQLTRSLNAFQIENQELKTTIATLKDSITSLTADLAQHKLALAQHERNIVEKIDHFAPLKRHMRRVISA